MINLIDLLKNAKSFHTADGKNYQIIRINNRRYYIESVTEKSYNLENTTPYRFYSYGEHIEDHAWVNFLPKIVNFLNSKKPVEKNRLLEFKTNWSNAKIFTEKKQANSKLLANGLYLNCNHTAQHSCWLIQDILKFWEITPQNAVLMIHRPSGAEPSEIRDAIKKEVTSDFAKWLKVKHDVYDEEFQRMMGYYEKVLNPTLRCKTKSYVDFFLFDDSWTAYNYSKVVQKEIEDRVSSVKTQRVFIDCLKLLLEYYKEKGY